MKEFYTKVIALACSVAALSCAIFGAVYFGITGVYDNSYQKGFVYQYRSLQNAPTDENKIIVIGGSYMTFATDSAQLQDLTGMPSYTLGIHSGMGMSYTIETAEQFANPGDILVFSFSPFEADTYGMDLIYLSLDGEPDLFWDFFKNHPGEVLKSAGAVVYTKLYSWQTQLRRNLKGRDISSVYDARAFDPETGNLIYERKGCEVAEADLHSDNPLSVDRISDMCVGEVAALAEFCKNKGVSFYMVYTPFFAGYYGNPSESELSDYQESLEKCFNVTLLADVSDCAVPMDYVYNGALHMNDVGKDYYTNLIFEGLRQVAPQIKHAIF